MMCERTYCSRCERHSNGLDPERGSLTGSVRLVRNWGRIGTNGQELAEIFATEIEAGRALEGMAALKRRRGYRDL